MQDGPGALCSNGQKSKILGQCKDDNWTLKKHAYCGLNHVDTDTITGNRQTISGCLQIVDGPSRS